MTKPHSDLISLFARHRVAPNLLMILMIVSGLFALSRLNTQFFPDFALDVISIRVEWRGASAEDVEDAITQRLENELRTLDFLDKITSSSAYGVASISLEFEEKTDMGPALDQVKERVSQVRNLPIDAETPEIALRTRYDSVASFLVSSEGDLTELRPLIYRMEKELLERGIARIEITGLPEEEIAIQIKNAQLEALGLDLQTISQKVASLSRDLPAGVIGEKHVSRQIRSLEQRRTVKDFANLPVITTASGQLLRLGDIATIELRPKEKQVAVYHNDKATVQLKLQRTENNDSLTSAKIFHQWLEDTRPTLPPTIKLQVFDEKWKSIKERINLLLKNGLGGLILVVAILFIFLHGRVAWWVAVGIPVSFMATLLVMLVLGGSINMISLFGLIMALGIIVDDAIVVGENALSHYQRGENALQAAEGGARRMLAPVTASSLTTVAAFLPLMLIGGTTGNILFDIPFVVVCVIIASLVESFLVLPGHLRHTLHRLDQVKADKTGNTRRWLDDKFNAFRDKQFRSLVSLAVDYRWITLSMISGLLILSIGLMAGGRLSFTFFPSPEGTTLYANASFVAGTPEDKVEHFLEHLQETLIETEHDLGDGLVDIVVTKQGSAAFAGGGSITGDRYGSMQIELISPDRRTVRNKHFLQNWRERINSPAGLENLTLSERRSGPSGSDIDIRFTGGSARTMKQASEELINVLKQYSGVSAIEDDMPYGQEQLIYQINPLGDALGLTIVNVGQQIRAAFDGHLTQIFQDKNDEVEVRVMLPDNERNTLATLESFMLRLPDGNSTALNNVVTWKVQRGFDVLRHSAGQLALHVTANVDADISNSNQILKELQQQALPELASKYGLQIGFEGRAESQAETMGEMKQGLIYALGFIYIVLAWVFSSYGWPLVVMAAIPFGLIGAMAGHWLMDIDLTILSLFGLFGLSGIVVNDSIILVSFFKDLRHQGLEIREAIIDAACQRLRAVLLTSLTTIAGLTPLLFETSFQAQFLIPMAVSISFGLMFSTILVLLIIPALLSIHESIVGQFDSHPKELL